MRKICSVLLGLCLGSLSVAHATEATVDVALATDTRVQRLMSELDGTEWSGKAGFFLNSKQSKTHLLENEADMAFGLLDGKLYYLSSINKKLDEVLDAKAQGLCVKSPPKRVELVPSADGKTFSATIFVQMISKKTGEKTFKQIALRMFRIEADKLIISDIELDGALKQIPIRYSLSKKSSSKSAELASKLKVCLEKQPWLDL